MAAADRCLAVVSKVRDIAPPDFFDGDARDLIARLPDRARGALSYLASGAVAGGTAEGAGPLKVRDLLEESRLTLLSEEALTDVSKSLVAIATRDAERHAAQIRSIVFRPKVDRIHTGPPAGKKDVLPFLERLGASALATERAKPLVRETLDPRVLVRMPYELTVEAALAASWGDGTMPSWVLMPVRDAVAKAVAEQSSAHEQRDESDWEGAVLSPVLTEIAEVLLRERRKVAKSPVRKIGFRAHLDPTSVTLALTYEQGLPPAVLHLSQAHLGVVRFEGNVDEPSRRRLLELALDALSDVEHPLHGPLRNLLEEPAWERTLRRLGTFVRARKERGEGLDRIAFRVSRDPDLTIEPVRQKLLTSGGWSKGARELGAISELGAESQEQYARFVRAARSGGAGLNGAAFAAVVGLTNVVDLMGEPITVRRGRARVVATDDGAGITLAVRIGAGAPSTFDVFLRETYDGDRHAVAYDEERRTIDVAEVHAALARLSRTLGPSSPIIPKSELPRLEPLLFALAEEVPLEWPTSLRGEPVEADHRPYVYLSVRPIGGEARIAFRPLPEAPDVVPGEGDALVVAPRATPDGDPVRVSVVRDRDHEAESARRWAKQLGLEPHATDGPFSYVILNDEPFLDVVQRAREAGERVVVQWKSEAQRTVRGRIGGKNTSVVVHTLGNWLSLDGTVSIDGQQIALAEVLAALRERRRYVRLSDGSFAAIEDELRQRLATLARVGEGGEGEAVRLPVALMHLVEALDDPRLGDDVASLHADAAWTDLRARAAALATRAIELPDTLVGTLRDYQLDGYRWLTRLSTLGVGACLADDMGLGKTVQALALLLARAERGPALVIAPTSVGPNWVAEAARFSPSLDVVLYRGRDRRALLEGLRPGAVLVTSYDIATLDVEALKEVQLATLVLDEAQMLKNAGTQRGRAVRKLRAEATLALTGTPLENHLGELWSLFDVLTPGLLGSEDAFRERFARPIELEGDPEVHDALRTIVRPFVLRRRKAEVAPELPARTEVLHPVELSEAERTLYEAERAAALKSMMGDGPRDARAEGAIYVLAVISRLRQLACHPKLVHPESSAASSKLAALLSVLDDVERAGGRALVFSEWTRLLGYVRQALEARRVPHLYLDGETPALERASRVARFQAGEGKVFLLSLRAGGTGLNLTGADWVIHLDPWWNPAVEDQATDRAHRIGQTKPVTVVRLVAQGTIEEAVMGLHAHKRQLASGVLEGTEAVGSLAVDELMDLIRGADVGAAELRKSKARRARAPE